MIVVASVLAFFTHRIKQPLIIAYIVTGLIVGPSVLGLSGDPHAMQSLSQIGVAFLLFLVGLNLNWRNIKELGPVSIVAGFGQALVTSGIGYLVAVSIGFDTVTSAFIGVAFAFSSTIIVVKLLADKLDLDRLYGRMSIGILIVQDLLAMAVLLVIGALGVGMSIGDLVIITLLKTLFVILILWWISHFLLPQLFTYAARSQELLFLAAIGWCFVVAGALHLVGFGIEIGALLAGVSLAGTDFHREIESKVKPLRDFFLILFFIALGTHLDVYSLGDIVVPALIMSAFVLVGNALIVIFILRALGYHPRIGFLSGVGFAQISEFSFIVLAGGIASGIIDTSVLPFATLVALITIAVSSYLITYNEQIYQRIHKLFDWFAPHNPKGENRIKKAPEILLLGYRDMGARLYPALKRLKMRLLVVDFDPVIIDELKKNRIPSAYGDVGNDEFLSHIRAEKAKMIVSTIPDNQVSESLTYYLKQKRSKATIILTAKTNRGAAKLYDIGATFVIVLSVLGGAHFAEMLKKKRTEKRRWKALAKRHLS